MSKRTDFLGDWQECYKCGGNGEDDTMCECQMIEDNCVCLHPAPVRCDICRGKGGWAVI